MFAATIVIPLLDQDDRWLEQSVLSALEQSVRSETIVVYSPRTRRSNLELLERLQASHSNLRIIPRGSRNFPGALNLGFREASAERIGLLMSDDWLDPNTIALCLKHDVDIVSTGHAFYDSEGTTHFHGMDWIPREDLFVRIPTLERKASYLKHFFLFRKSKLDEIEGADETLGNFPGIDDFDMIWVLLEHNASCALVPELVYNIRDHEGDRLTLKPRLEALQGLNRILDKHQVPESERDEIIGLHKDWYGEPTNRVFSRLRYDATKKPPQV